VKINCHARSEAFIEHFKSSRELGTRLHDTRQMHVVRKDPCSASSSVAHSATLLSVYSNPMKRSRNNSLQGLMIVEFWTDALTDPPPETLA
jgi:hypothetical protein